MFGNENVFLLKRIQIEDNGVNCKIVSNYNLIIHLWILARNCFAVFKRSNDRCFGNKNSLHVNIHIVIFEC